MLRFNPLLLLLLVIGLTGCKDDKVSPSTDLQAEYVHRMHDEVLFQPTPAQPKQRNPYPWEEGIVGQYPKITKEYFRCKGSSLNPPKTDQQVEEVVHIYDCGGSQKHSLPIRDGKEFIYPILTDLLNYLQVKTNKKVVITSGHRCPDHNMYVNPAVENQCSKHMIGAEVSFYVQGMEDRPESIVKWIMDYYAKTEKYQGLKEYQEFKRYEKDDTDVNTQPWYNKEVFVKLYKKKEGRDYDNRHPYPYLSIQVRYDQETKETVIYTWIKANREFMRY